MGKDDYGWSQVIGRWSSYGLEPSCNGVWPSWQLMWWHDAGDIILDAVFLIPEAVIFTCPVVTRRCGGPKSNHVGSLNSVGSAVLAVALLSFLAEVKLASYCRFRSWWFSRNGALPLHVLHEVHKLQCWVLLLHADPSESPRHLPSMENWKAGEYISLRKTDNRISFIYPIGSMVLVYMLSWLVYIDGKCYHIWQHHGSYGYVFFVPITTVSLFFIGVVPKSRNPFHPMCSFLQTSPFMW